MCFLGTLCIAVLWEEKETVSGFNVLRKSLFIYLFNRYERLLEKEKKIPLKYIKR